MTIEKSESKSDIEKAVNFKIPKDHVIDHIEAKCKKHGDISNATLVLTYGTVKDGEKVMHTNLFCIQCLAELLQKFQEEGKIETVEVQQFIREMTDEEKEKREEQLKEIEKLRQKAVEIKQENQSQVEVLNAVEKANLEAWTKS
jgi:hypothetical protein